MPAAALEGQALDWLAIIGASLCSGSWAVPMKWPSVVQAQVHPLVYQSHKTLWVFLTSHLVLFVEPYELSLWGLASGLMWVPAGTAGVIAVRHVGLARAQATWQTTIIATSFVWGFLVLRDSAVRSSWVALLGAAAVGFGVVGMALSFNGPAHAYQIAPAEADSTDMEAAAGQPTVPSVALGFCAAVFNGLWGGSMLVPQHFAPCHGVGFALSFAWGAVAVNAALLLGNAVLAFFGLVAPALPQLRVMALPGFFSGVTWSAGNLCSLYAVAAMGQAMPSALIQCSVVVSGFWGICYFGELQGKPVLLWSLWMVLCVFGVFILAFERE